MLVKALDIPTEEELTYTGYTDEIPGWLRPYLAAAMRSGFTDGFADPEVFGANEVITEQEASVLLRNALNLTAEEAFAAQTDAPVSRGLAAQLLYQAVKTAQTQKIDRLV
jgi:hypothetical protein